MIPWGLAIFLIIFGTHMNTFIHSSSKWRPLSSSNGHIHFPIVLIIEPRIIYDSHNSKPIYLIHPKLLNINLHNVTHSLIYHNPREQMFVVQISLLIVTFLSLISRNSSLMQTTKEVNPHPHIAPCVNMWSVFFFFFFFFIFFNLLNVSAYVRHIAQEGPME
jgi:hypothetical protein